MTPQHILTQLKAQGMTDREISEAIGGKLCTSAICRLRNGNPAKTNHEAWEAIKQLAKTRGITV